MPGFELPAQPLATPRFEAGRATGTDSCNRYGTRWQVTALNNGRQAVVGVLDGTSLTMVFGNDGKLSGSAGCNNFNATYRAEGSALNVGAPVATRMMCAQPEGRMAQEAQFLAALASMAQARREGNRIELRTATDALAVSARLAPP